MIEEERKTSLLMPALRHTRTLWAAPLLVVFVLIACHQIYLNYLPFWLDYFSHPETVIRTERFIYTSFLGLCGYWLFLRGINQGFQWMQQRPLLQKHATVTIVLPFFASLFKVLFFLVCFNVVTQYYSLGRELSHILNKISSVFIIAAIGLILSKFVDVTEQLLIRRYSDNLQGNSTARKIYTQALIFKRVAYAVITILTLGAVLMLFENVRALGASVLTTAGIAGLVITFTAQRSLANLFSGLDMALTQPIKIGDIIVINNEFGTVEEINFRNVIVKLWDWRRLVVPTSYFLENSFQNWSHKQDNSLIGAVDLYADFTLPVEKVRQELKKILSASSYWDRRVGKLVVQDLKETVMQLRILASAANADATSNLRSELREKIMDYIARTFPESLPACRTHNINEGRALGKRKEMQMA